MRPESDASLSRSQPGPSKPQRSRPSNEEVLHTWSGVVGPRPTILSLLSVLSIAAIFAHLVIDLPPLWPFAAGLVALVFNLALAVWQAGSVRVVAVTASGIQVMRKARWRSRCTHLVGTMPRMPLGPVSGRWSRSSIANTVMWVHRKHHPTIVDFDSLYLSTFSEWHSGNAARVGGRGSILEGLDQEGAADGVTGADTGPAPEPGPRRSLLIDVDGLEAAGSELNQPDADEVAVD